MRTPLFPLLAIVCATAMTAQQATAPPRGVQEVPQALLEVLPSSPKVSYPADASRDSVQGVVVLGVTISPEGKVEKVDILDGPDRLAKPTAKTVGKWSFKPFVDGAGKPQRVYSEFTFNFAFRDKITDRKDEDPGASAATQNQSHAPLQVAAGTSQGMLLHQVAPVYPAAAQVRHIQGAVVLDAIITPEGKIKDLKVVKGNPLLAEAALAAVRQWRYRPFRIDGIPQEVQTQITVNFALSR